MKKRSLVIALIAFLGGVGSSYAQIMPGDYLGPLGGGDVANYPTNSSLGYKGVVMANFDPADAADELVADFGAIGLWYFNDGAWTQLSGLNVEAVISACTKDPSDDELVADFGATGVWYWDGLAWLQLSGVNPEGMIALDDDGGGTDELQVDFGTIGVWRFQFDDGAWIQYSGLNPVNGFRADLAPAGKEEGVWNFATAGMWSMNENASGGIEYKQLSGAYTTEGNFASAHFIDSTGPEDIVADFGSLGLWLCKGSDGSWVQISSMNAKRIMDVKFTEPENKLVVEDSAGGLYWAVWNGTGMSWSPIISPGIVGIVTGSNWCEAFDLYAWDSGDEEVLIPLATGGAYLFDYSLNYNLKEFMNSYYIVNFAVKGDYYGKGRDSTLATVFGSSSYEPGLWLHENESNPVHWGWIKISAHIPDGMY